MLEIRNVSKTYRRRDGAVSALRDVSLDVPGGEFVAVRGPSGSGKTTLLLASGGLLEPDAGQILLDGRNPYALDHDGRARLRSEEVGFVFQQFHLVPYLSVMENVLAPSLAGAGDGAHQRAEELIRRFGLAGRTAHVPAELSTGECQRVALARALLNRPKLILADEPTGNLDEDNAATVLGCLAEFAQAGGAVLLVTHSAAVAKRAGRTVQLEEGKF